MHKWFEQTENRRPNVVNSRIRLVRNWDQYRFPKTLAPMESEELVKKKYLILD